jgi:oligopeptide transport system ATP-binding protein
MSLLEVENLSVSFSLYGKTLYAVRGVSFQIEEGEAVGIVGESGCGKSATVQAILRLSPASAIQGKIRFQGEELTALKEDEMRKIRGLKMGVVFQDPLSALNPTMTIGSQIMEGLLYHKIATKEEAKKRALDLLKEVEIGSPKERFHQYPHQLSGGQRQRVLIAIALAAGPRLLIADEPTTALDVTIQAQILDLLKKRSRSMSLLLITHDLAVAAAVTNRILVFYAGKIVEEGPVREILVRPRHPYTQMLLRSIPHLDRPRSDRLETIPGSPPQLMTLPKGCAFRERCPLASPICQKEPPFIGSAACWRAIQ